MDMKRLIAALTGISIMFFAGCAGDKATKDALQNAEVLMDERPDSALEILSSINDQSIFGKSVTGINKYSEIGNVSAVKMESVIQ